MRRDVERLETGGDDDRADLDLLELLLLGEVDGLLFAAGFDARLLALVGQDAALEIEADLRVDQHHLGRGLGERDVDRLALAEALVEFVGELGLLVDAVGDALLAAGAEVLVDVPGLALDGDGVVADVAVHLHDLGIAPQRDVLVRADLGHLRGEDAGGAIQRREGLVELRHVPADGGLALDEVNLLAGVGQGQRGVDAGDAAADHEDVGMDGNFFHLQGLVVRHALDGGAGQGLGLGGGLRAVGVHPRVVLADVDHVEEERIQPAGRDRVAEGAFVEQGRAGGDDDPVQVELLDVLLDELLARIGAHVLVVAGQDHAGKLLDVFRDRRAVDHAGDVVPAMADVETDAHVCFSGVHGTRSQFEGVQAARVWGRGQPQRGEAALEAEGGFRQAEGQADQLGEIDHRQLSRGPTGMLFSWFAGSGMVSWPHRPAILSR